MCLIAKRSITKGGNDGKFKVCQMEPKNSPHAFLYGVVNLIIPLVVGTIVTQWYAEKKGWDNSFKIAAEVNLLLYGMNIAVGGIIYVISISSHNDWYGFGLFLYAFIFYYFSPLALLDLILSFCMQFIIGIFVMKVVYKQEMPAIRIFTLITIIMTFALVISIASLLWWVADGLIPSIPCPGMCVI